MHKMVLAILAIRSGKSPHRQSGSPLCMNLQKSLGYCFPSLDKEGWREAPEWFDHSGYPIFLLKIIQRGVGGISREETIIGFARLPRD